MISNNPQRRMAGSTKRAVRIRTTDHTDVAESCEPHKLRSKPAWAYVWHVWKVIIPRRSITGALVYGQVLRRHNGRRWIYQALAK
jgi:hypothetical protein